MTCKDPKVVGPKNTVGGGGGRGRGSGSSSSNDDNSNIGSK